MNNFTKKITAYIFASSVLCNAMGQKYLEPIVGYKLFIKNAQIGTTTVNNIVLDKKSPINYLKQLLTSFQYSIVVGKKFEHAFQLSIGNPIKTSFIDSSFTLNPLLPLYKPTTKKLTTSSIFISYIPNFKVVNITKNDRLNAFCAIGIGVQTIKVKYDNDENNYIILNPDKTITKAGVQFGVGFQYAHTFTNSRIFLQSQLDFPIITTRNKYPSASKNLLPVGFAIGYSIKI